MVVRRIWGDARTGDYGRETLRFPGLRAILRVDHTTIPREGPVRTETRYFATSLEPARVSAPRLLAILRGHWQIENSLHFVIGLTRFNEALDRRHDRRTIGADELARLIQAAHDGPTYRKMTGPARALVYCLAVASGLRHSELRSLKVSSIDLGRAPSLTLEAAYSKNGQTAILPLPSDLADDLGPYLASLPEGAPAFHLSEKGARMLRVDLEAACIPYPDASCSTSTPCAAS